jgi:SNF2 family DNA or RNA helicase
MKLIIKPPVIRDKNGKSKKPRLGLPRADTALEFHVNEISKRAFHRQFTLEVLEKNQEHVEVLVTDGRRRKNKIQYFSRNRGIACCSCDEYVIDQCRFCVHMAAVENALKWPRYYGFAQNYRKWCNIFKIRLQRIPTESTRYKQNYVFYDPYSDKLYSFGQKKPTQNTVSTKTFKRIQTKKSQKKVKYLPKPDDTGLLQEVTLYDYQKEVFRNMLKAQRAICSMIMGSGKTITTIACYAFIDKYKPKENASMLIIGPKSLRYQWGNEIKRTCGKEVFQIENQKHIEPSKDHDVNIVTYQFLTRHIDKFLKRKFDIVVVDEIQFIRNAKTKTWKAISKLKSDFFFGLSGTVIENRLDDLYSIMEIINPGVLGPKWKFDDKFQELKIKSRSKLVYGGVKNLQDLKELLKDNVFSYDQLNLPAIQHHYCFVGTDKYQLQIHDGYYEEAKKLIAKSLNGDIMPHERLLVQSLLLKARQASNTTELISKTHENPSKKIKEFLKLVKNTCINGGEKLVVFSDWVEMLQICARHVAHKYKLDFVFFTGKQSSKQRQAALEKFQTNNRCKIFFASDAGGLGLDGLQLASSKVVHLELPWNPAKLDQRSGRVHRLLQTNNVDIYHLVSKDTIEEHIHSLLQEKKNVRIKTLAKFHI